MRDVLVATYGRVQIVEATQRDLTFVAASLRPEDHRELSCQMPDDMPVEIGAVISAWSGEAWVAKLDGQPVAAFGAAPMSLPANVLSLWAWGTKRLARAAPAITRFVRDEMAPKWVERGVTRVEARSIEGHHQAHRWLTGAGAFSIECLCWGKGGEAFRLFWWTKDSWRR